MKNLQNTIGGMLQTAMAIPSIAACGDPTSMSTSNIRYTMADHANDGKGRTKELDVDKRKVMLITLGFEAWEGRTDGELAARIQDERNKLIERFTEECPDMGAWDDLPPDYKARYLEESQDLCRAEALHALGQEVWADLSKTAQDNQWDK